MSKIILEKLIYKSYLKTALTSILFIEIALILIYFSANRSIVNESVEFILKDIKNNVHTLVKNIKSNVENKFNDIEKFVFLLQNEHQNFFKYQDKIDMEANIKFEYASNGMYYKVNNNGGSSVVVSNDTKITPTLMRKLINTELFDKTFKRIVNDDEMIVAAYFNSHDNFSRYYPYIENTYDAFPPNIKMQNYNFYYEANLENNPEKKVVWTDVYLDPAGQGWMFSAIAPIYNKGFLEGVTGLDITVNSVINSFLNLEIPYNGSSFLIDKNGNVIAITKKIANIIDLKSHEKYKYNEKVETTILKDDNENIFKHSNKEFVSLLKNVVDSKPYNNNVLINDEKYLVFSHEIKKTNWYVISMIGEKDILSTVRELEDYYVNVGYLIVIFIVLFYLIFFIYLYKKSKELVKTLNTPLKKIIELTKDLGRKKNIKHLEKCGIDEIDTLSENFNNLATELEKRTAKLIDSETKRLVSENLANSDPLTGVYNRRFLEEFSKSYMKIVKREHGKFSLLLIDIDNFKSINDTHGHDIGDIILKNLVNCIKSIVRGNDMIVRLGGDEFLILLPSTNKSNAKEVALKLMNSINTFNEMKDDNLKFTITVGTSEFDIKDTCIDPLIKRADEALYEAKGLGKNCIV